MHVRAARPSDATMCCDVLRRSITELCEADHGNDAAFLAGWLANKTAENVAEWIKSSHVVVAEEKDRILGVAALTSSGTVTLNYVAPDARFLGVSKALIRAIEAKAVELGCPACFVESTKTAERFYRSAGYRDRDDGRERSLWKPLAQGNGTTPDM